MPPTLKSRIAWLEVVTFFTLLSCCACSLTTQCPTGEFYSTAHNECQKCSMCPMNQIIRKPCSNQHNTVCGPFSEFQAFHQAPRPSLDLDSIASDQEDVDSNVNRSKKQPWGVEDDFQDKWRMEDWDTGKKHWRGHLGSGLQADKSDRNAAETQSEHRGTVPERGQVSTLQSSEGDDSRWKVLALALIGVLCIVCLFLIVFVFVVCYMRSQRYQMKQAFYQTDLDSSGRPVPSSNLYVPVVTHITGTQSTLRPPPYGLTDSCNLYSQQDHSGHTTKSSDYVYFKSPQNGNFAEV